MLARALIRIALGATAAVLAAAVGLLAFLPAGRRRSAEVPVFLRTPAGETRPQSGEDCRSCHADRHSEWSRSRHAYSWVNPQLEAWAALSLGLDDCVRCHAPAPVFQTGLDREPEARLGNRDTGVDCLTCHAGRAGLVGPSGNHAAPCLPIREDGLRKSAVCASCHRTIGLDWLKSKAAKSGIQCQDCHMPREIGGRGRSHEMRGSRCPELMKSAFSMNASVLNGKLEVAVSNVAAGHNFPAERHFRSLHIFVLWLDQDGQGLQEERRTIKDVNPIRQARQDSMIRAGSTETFSFEPCEGAAKAKVRLVYKFYPSDLDSEAQVLKELWILLK